MRQKISKKAITNSISPYLLRFLGATLLVGISSGLSGMCLALLLHAIQHLAYDYSLDVIISNESFLQGVTASSAQHRIMILSLCGLIAGFGWWAVYRYGKPLVSINEAIKTNKPMPPLTTITHILLQIITVALGSPLGREVAPRELGTLAASWICTKTGLTAQETRIMLACGAGAGLAAVYNVPLGGALFVMEVLMGSLSWPILLPALATSSIAVAISWIGLGNHAQYHLPDFTINTSLIVWSILSSPIIGLAAYWFIYVANIAVKQVKHNWQFPILGLLNFSLIGLLAIYFPALLGNGKSPAQLAFDNAASIELITALLFLRILITWSSIRAGAHGGLLTPSLAVGALLAAALGNLWNLVWASSPLGAYAVIGAAAFLAAAQRMPLTAIILIFELTRFNFSFLIPVLFAVTAAVGSSSWYKKMGRILTR